VRTDQKPVLKVRKPVLTMTDIIHIMNPYRKREALTRLAPPPRMKG
jgi:hypothetical protein